MNRFFTTASLIAVSFVAAESNAAEIFGAAQGGDFFGAPLSADADVFNGSSTGGGLTGGRRGGNATFFFENILFEGSGFTGVDQVDGSGDPGHFTNNNTSTTATFFANSGSVSGATNPNGAFAQAFNPGDIIGVSLEINSNDPTTTSTWDISIEFVGGTLDGTTQSLISGNFGSLGPQSNATAYTLLAGETATGFNVISTLVNPSTTNDQVQVDDIVLTLVPEPSSLALLGLGGLLIARRRRD